MEDGIADDPQVSVPPARSDDWMIRTLHRELSRVSIDWQRVADALLHLPGCTGVAIHASELSRPIAVSGNGSADLHLPIHFGTSIRGRIDLAGNLEPQAWERLPWIVLSLTAHFVRLEEARQHGEHLRGAMHNLRGGLGRLAALAEYRGMQPNTAWDEVSSQTLDTVEGLINDLSAYAHSIRSFDDSEICNLRETAERAIYESRSFWPQLATEVRIDVPDAEIPLSEVNFAAVLVRALRCLRGAIADSDSSTPVQINGKRIPGGIKLVVKCESSRRHATSALSSDNASVRLCERILQMHGGNFVLAENTNEVMVTIAVPSIIYEG